jgi:adenylate kinase
MFICLVDNIEVVHHRLHREHDIDATLKDCMVWREEEILATELLSKAIPGSSSTSSAAAATTDTTRTCFRGSSAAPDMKKVYPSFPMSHVVDMPDVLAEIDDFRADLAKHFITFDPGDVDEKLLLDRAIAAARKGQGVPRRQPALLRRRKRHPEPIGSACAKSSTSPATSTARSTCATSSSSTSPT